MNKATGNVSIFRMYVVCIHPSMSVESKDVCIRSFVRTIDAILLFSNAMSPFNSPSFVLSPPTAALRVMLELLVAVCFSTAHIFNANDTLSPSIDWLTEATKREHVKIRYAWKCTAPGDNFKCMLLIYIRCRFFGVSFSV